MDREVPNKNKKNTYVCNLIKFLTVILLVLLFLPPPLLFFPFFRASNKHQVSDKVWSKNSNAQCKVSLYPTAMAGMFLKKHIINDMIHYITKSALTFILLFSNYLYDPLCSFLEMLLVTVTKNFLVTLCVWKSSSTL